MECGHGQYTRLFERRCPAMHSRAGQRSRSGGGMIPRPERTRCTPKLAGFLDFELLCREGRNRLPLDEQPLLPRSLFQSHEGKRSKLQYLSIVLIQEFFKPPTHPDERFQFVFLHHMAVIGQNAIINHGIMDCFKRISVIFLKD
jgi:hypothetical protein